MGDKKGRLILTVLAVFLFLLALSLSLFLIFYRIPRSESINYYLSQCDSLYDEGKYRQAGDMLDKSSSFTRGRSDWQRIIKRAHMISSESGDWDIYRKYSERAVKLYQGNEEFWVFYLTSLLWSGKYDQLEKYRDRLAGGSYPTIQAELRLTEESLSIDKTLTPYDGVMQRLEREEDADFFQLVGDISGIDDLKIDAIILNMGLGERKKAEDIVQTLSHPEQYLQILGLLYWDLGKIETSLDYLSRQDEIDKKNHNRRWTMNNILGDGYFLLGNWEKAEYHYLTSLEIKEDENWRPYVNRAMIYEKEGIWKQASLIILDALDGFSDRREVVLYFLDNWQETYPVRAERVVNSYLNNHPDDVEVRLEHFASFPEEMTPESYRAFLWELFNDNSSNEKVTRYLLWYMAVLGDFDSMRIIMERHERVAGVKPEWYSLYEGLIAALDEPRDYEGAVQQLSVYYDETHDWYGAWNMAVLLDHMGRKSEAEGMMKKAVRN